MDLFSQGAIAAALPLATRQRQQTAMAAFIGFCSGLVPDLDILIRSEDDTLLALEFHRQFTHSLIFVPFGSAVLAIIFHRLLAGKAQISFLEAWLFCGTGLATHGLLDAATSYGTMLFWPFSSAPITLNIVSIIDPLFTAPVTIFVITGVVLKDGRWGCLAMIWAATYLLAAAIQQQNAISLVRSLADNRGHTMNKLVVKPTFGNILLWRSVYEFGGYFYVDAVRPAPSPKIFTGAKIQKLDVARDFPWVDSSSQQATDIKRFQKISQNYLAKAPDNSQRIIDVRYALLPTEISPFFFIRIDRNASSNSHVIFDTDRGANWTQFGRLLALIVSKP